MPRPMISRSLPHIHIHSLKIPFLVSVFPIHYKIKVKTEGFPPPHIPIPNRLAARKLNRKILSCLVFRGHHRQSAQSRTILGGIGVMSMTLGDWTVQGRTLRLCSVKVIAYTSKRNYRVFWLKPSVSPRGGKRPAAWIAK